MNARASSKRQLVVYMLSVPVQFVFALYNSNNNYNNNFYFSQYKLKRTAQRFRDDQTTTQNSKLALLDASGKIFQMDKHTAFQFYNVRRHCNPGRLFGLHCRRVDEHRKTLRDKQLPRRDTAFHVRHWSHVDRSVCGIFFGRLSQAENNRHWVHPNFDQLLATNATALLVCHENELDTNLTNPSTTVGCEETFHYGAYAIIAFAQLLAGISAAPFNTIAYIYIDDNVSNRDSPFYLGLLTGMYAFGPAFGFLLSAGCTNIYVDLQDPVDINRNSPFWIGAWWLGFVVCGILYIIFGIPLFFFPYRLSTQRRLMDRIDGLDASTPLSDNSAEITKPATLTTSCKQVVETAKALPQALYRLIKNPVYTSMALGWIFGSYLIGGYGTYLPKFIETQFSQTASMADIYSGLISIGSVAFSTALGGYLLSRFNIQPRFATLLLIITWAIIFFTYLLGIAFGCDQVTFKGMEQGNGRWNFTTECSQNCHCSLDHQFKPVCDGQWTYYSPCYAGCRFQAENKTWMNCQCAAHGEMTEDGVCPSDCTAMSLYITTMFVGLFIGNLFFMTTMTVVLRSVELQERSLALSFASFLTNVLGKRKNFNIELLRISEL
ncbi:solute carrier organic anion transporter family member 5A1 [Trichinella spiralis]|uniref:solute carrier organic anion transporter family member 5A1 n=1 Tax=Trichinella spiralis TaxID=6334 RepID=UPI0001EFD104|nr:solute carrier organic anion transporter family member 5A1 [Trichinella spiralis]